VKRGVLVVDDDPFIRKLVATTLEDVSKFELYEAADGIEALQIAEREQPAIIFLDVEMPRPPPTTKRLSVAPRTPAPTCS